MLMVSGSYRFSLYQEEGSNVAIAQVLKGRADGFGDCVDLCICVADGGYTSKCTDFFDGSQLGTLTLQCFHTPALEKDPRVGFRV